MHGSSSVPKELVDIINKYGGKMKPTYGVPVEEIQRGIKHGVRKINVDTDNRLAITGAIRKVFAETAGEVRPARLPEAGPRGDEEGRGAAHDRVRPGRPRGRLPADPARRDGQAVRRTTGHEVSCLAGRGDMLPACPLLHPPPPFIDPRTALRYRAEVECHSRCCGMTSSRTSNCVSRTRKGSLFAAVAFAVLALALGANASIFNLLNTVLLRPIYAGQPETLAAVSTISADGRPSGFSYRAYEEIRRNQGVFSSMFAWFARGIYSVEANGSLAPGSVVLVTPAYYDVLRVRPLMGRTFREGDEAARAAVISYRCWRTRFGGQPDIIGKSFRVEGHPYTVMGVMPEQFRGYSIGIPEDITIALPAWFEAEQVRESARPSMEIGGRLKDDASLALAGQELGTLWPAVRAGVMPSDLTPAQRKNFLAQRLTVSEGRAGSATDYVRRRYRRPLFILMGAVGITLLIACANLSGLLVSRAAARRQDTAIRLAMGAGRWRLLRQSFVEALLLALPAVAAGAAVGVWISRGLADFMWTSLLPHELNLTPDWRVYGWLAALAILIAIAASAAPVWQVSHRASASLITGVTRGRAGVTHGVGKWLVSAQSALALVLLTAAALFGTSFRNLKASALGFEVETVLAMQLTNRPGNTMTDAERPEYYRQLLPEVSRVPGVRAVTLTRTSPIIPWQFDVREPVTASGGSAEAGAYRHDVTPGIFETFGILLVRGRALVFTDTEHTPRVAVVSRSLAALLFPSGDAVGRRISVGTAPEGQNVQIAGIAEDASLWNIRRRRPPQIYLSYLQQPERMASPTLGSGPADYPKRSRRTSRGCWTGSDGNTRCARCRSENWSI